MTRSDATASAESAKLRRPPGLLAIATATAVLVSGLNALLQIIRFAIELHGRGGF